MVLRRIEASPLDRVLVPLDGAETSEAVLDRISPLSRAVSGEILLLRVVPFLETLVALPEDLSADLFQPDLAHAWSYVNTVAERMKADGLDVRGLAVLGPPAGTILDVARGEQATLIAMSTRARSRLARLAFGSVASKVLRGSRVPTLLSPPSAVTLTGAGTWLSVGEPPRDVLRLSRRLGISLIRAGQGDDLLQTIRAIAADLVLIAVEGQDDRRRFERLLRRTSVPFLVMPA